MAKILLVDDSNTTLMMEQMILERRTSHKCILAGNGLEALSKARTESPDLIIMDVVMPLMNGFEACQRLRQQENTVRTPIILVSTRPEESYAEAGFHSGCNEYIAKPIDSGELVAIVRSYLGE
jgi:two-component system alkaline phosphatase synthesis response regulator PhoP